MNWILHNCCCQFIRNTKTDENLKDYLLIRYKLIGIVLNDKIMHSPSSMTTNVMQNGLIEFNNFCTVSDEMLTYS